LAPASTINRVGSAFEFHPLLYPGPRADPLTLGI
jgi:hypothetical protein